MCRVLETLWTKFRWELGPMFVSPSGSFAVAQELNNSGFVLLQTDRSISKAFTFFFFFCSINKIRYSSFVNFQKYIVFHGFYLTSLLKTVIWCYLGLTDHKALLLMLKLGSVAPSQLFLHRCGQCLFRPGLSSVSLVLLSSCSKDLSPATYVFLLLKSHKSK